MLSVLIATLLIVATYPVFSQTYDEGQHIAAGMEWLDRGTYSYETLTPPLARVAMALGPYLPGHAVRAMPSFMTKAMPFLSTRATTKEL